jgi:hypothetical protein
MDRINEWGRKAAITSEEIKLDTSDCFTTSIIVVEYVRPYDFNSSSQIYTDIGSVLLISGEALENYLMMPAKIL